MQCNVSGNDTPPFHSVVYKYMVTGIHLNLGVTLLDTPDPGVGCLIENRPVG